MSPKPPTCTEIDPRQEVFWNMLVLLHHHTSRYRNWYQCSYTHRTTESTITIRMVWCYSRAWRLSACLLLFPRQEHKSIDSASISVKLPRPYTTRAMRRSRDRNVYHTDSSIRVLPKLSESAPELRLSSLVVKTPQACQDFRILAILRHLSKVFTRKLDPVWYTVHERVDSDLRATGFSDLVRFQQILDRWSKSWQE